MFHREPSRLHGRGASPSQGCGGCLRCGLSLIHICVHTVEEFDPDPYLDALDKYGLPRSEDVYKRQAFIFCARRGSRRKTAAQLLPLAFTASLASVTEPMDFLDVYKRQG